MIVRSDLSQSICVQGAPGTGKTAVGLHRAAYLLFAHREQLTRQGVHGRRAQRQLPALHPRRAAGARRGRRDAVDDRRAGREVAARAQRRSGRSAARSPRPWRRSRATRGWPRCLSRALWSHVEHADRGARGAARRAAVAGGDVRGRGGRHLAAPPRGALRRGPRDGAAGAGPPDPGADGAGRRLPRRPRAERRRPQQAGQGLRRRAVAGRRSGPARVAAAVGRVVPGLRGRGAAVGGASRPRCCGPSRRRAPPRRRGRWPRRSWSTRPPTWSSAPARSATSWPTRPRTSRR